MSAHRLSNLARRLRTDNRGNVAVIAALAAVPLFTVVGAAVDYSKAAKIRTDLLAAVDAAVLRGCKEIQTQTVAVAKQRMQDTFAAMFTPAATFTPTVSPTINAGVVSAAAQSTYNVQLGVLVGLPNVPLHATSECEYANNTYEIALVMDNSGSMTGSAGSKTKIQASKDSAKSLIDSMYSGPTSASRVKVSVVPFSLSVNVGPQYRTAPWVDSTAQSSAHWNNFDYRNSPWKPANRFTLLDEMGIAFGGCFETRPGNFAVTDVSATPGQPDSYFVPQFAPDDPGPRASGASTYKFKQNGTGANVTYSYENSYLDDNTSGTGQCSGQTHNTWEVDKALTKLCKYKGNPTKNISNERGPNYMCDTQPLQRMINDPAALKTKIDSMVAEGNTNIFEGFMWGWRTISPNGPFADGRVYGQQPVGQPNNVKVMIVLTDGVNAWNGLSNSNGSRFSPAGFLQNTTSTATGYQKVGRFAPIATTTQAQGEAAMDSRLITACGNARAQGVVVYTIGFAAKTSEVDEAVLKACASPDPVTGAPQYYFASNSSQIDNVFKDIANKLSDLRLTK
jgi:Flp pilus assembly protein TadG